MVKGTKGRVNIRVCAREASSGVGLSGAHIKRRCGGGGRGGGGCLCPRRRWTSCIHMQTGDADTAAPPSLT